MTTVTDESGRILLVDDSSTIRKVVATILERHGYQVDSVADGELA